MEDHKTKSVPLIIYESEMQHKTNIIKGMFVMLCLLLVILGITIYLFISFISAYDFTGYSQDGNGVNNINSGKQGDVINESNIKTKD